MWTAEAIRFKTAVPKNGRSEAIKTFALHTNLKTAGVNVPRKI